MTHENVTLHSINSKVLIHATPKQLSDLELLITLCGISGDDSAHYNEFVSRFYEDLKSQCARICVSRRLNTHIGTQITHEVFERVRQYKSFQADAVKLADSRKGILVYLTRFAVRLFYDHHQKEKRQNEIINHKSYLDGLADGVANTNPRRLKEIRDFSVTIYNKLNAKEKTVVMADLEHKKHSKYLPDDITEQLAAELNVKTDTIRKIRQRALIKIKTAIDEFIQS